MMHDITFAVESITPAKARRYLEKNRKNRKLSKSVAWKYAKAIRKGEWRVNGEAIKFNGHGGLLDGQHRLQAVIFAKQTVPMCVIRGLDDDAFKTIDGGKMRTGGDCLYVLQYKHPNALAAAGRMLVAYENEWGGVTRSFRTVSNDELIAAVNRHPGLVRRGHEFMLKPLHTPLVPHSVGMFTYYLSSRVDADKARTFFAELGTGDYANGNATHPPRVLRERLEQTSREILKPSSAIKLAWVIEAWNCYAAGKPCRRLSRIVEAIPRLGSGQGETPMKSNGGVSRETDKAELCVYGRLFEWAVWATDRRCPIERHDDVAGDFRLTYRIAERIVASRRKDFPPACQAVDRAVASMKVEHDLVQLEYFLRQYFLEWKTVETIAIDEDQSEFHVTEILQRGLREVARRLPTFEKAVSC